MNFEEIKAKLVEMELTPQDMEYAYRRDEVVAALGTIEVVESYGGEGEGETYYYVLHFVDHGVYTRSDAHYTSYDGTDWSDSEFKECEKVPKTGYEFRNK